MRLLAAFALTLATACWSCGGRTLAHGEDDPPGTGGDSIDGAGGGASGSGGAGESGDGTPFEIAEVPGPLLTPGKCDSGFSPPLWDRLPSCNLTSRAACRDELDRMVLPPNVDVLEMAAQVDHLFVRTSTYPEPIDNDHLHFVGSGQLGEGLLQATFEHVYAVEHGCTPSCGDWLTVTGSLYAGTEGSFTPRSLSSWQEPTVNFLAGAYNSAVWARRVMAGSTSLSSFPQSSTTSSASVTFPEELVGLVTDGVAVYVATSGGELIQRSLPDFEELKRVPAQGVRIGRHDALIRNGGGFLFFSAAADGSVRAHSFSYDLELSEPGIDVTGATGFAEEFDDFFIATDHDVARLESDTERKVIATTDVPGSIRAIAFDDPFLYVASLGLLPGSEGFRVVIDALSIDSCTGFIR